MSSWFVQMTFISWMKKMPKHMFLRVLAAQMGVGGDDSWMSPVHPQYHIPADKPISLDVDLELI